MKKAGAYFNDLKEIQGLFPENLKVAGIGVTAFPRSALSYLLPDYSILSLLETADLSAIRKVCKVVSLEKTLKAVMPEKFNTSEMLQLPETKKYLMENIKALFLYKASKRSNRLADEMGLKVLSTQGKIRSRFENKKEFRIDAGKARINLISGESLRVDDLDNKKWDKYRKCLGERLVFQLTDYTVGGGLGTFFINNSDDFKRFKEFVKRRREVREIERVNVTRFISGKQASITGCVTKYGVVAGVLQAQIMDQPELAALHGRSGVWLGHDWYMRFSKKEQFGAEEQVKKWGEWIYKQGYRGIFGLDVMVDARGKIWPVECNSRYTGAFPVYTMMQLVQNEMPIDVWHLLEWLGVDYEMDIDEVQRVNREPKEGAQLVIHNMERKYVTPTKTVKAGVYRFFSDGKRKKLIEYVRPGFSMLDIKSQDEMVLCDKLVGEEMILKPAERIGRLLFKRRVMDDKGRLMLEIGEVVKEIYKLFELMPVEVEI